MEAGNCQRQRQVLEARDQARSDQSLRADSAYNLGLTYAKEAQSLEESIGDGDGAVHSSDLVV